MNPRETRVLCLHLPNWPIQRLLQDHPELADSPLVLYGRQGRQARAVWACNSLASEAGVRLGMPLVEAKRHCLGCVQAMDQGADEAALEQLAIECQRFSPFCGTHPRSPYRLIGDTLLLDVGATARFFGSTEILMEQVLEFFKRQRLVVHGVIAKHWASAWALAVHLTPAISQSNEAELAGNTIDLSADTVALQTKSWVVEINPEEEQRLVARLPIEALWVNDQVKENLKTLGLRTVGEVCRLPMASIPARFGPELVERLEQLAGRTKTKIKNVQPTVTFEGLKKLDYPTKDVEVLQLHVNDLLGNVLKPLVDRQQGVLSLICQWFFSQNHPPYETSLRLVQPVQDAKYLLGLLQLHWERLALDEEISAIRVWVPLTADDKPQQQWLFSDHQAADSNDRSSLIDRMSARLGAENIVQLRWQSQALPERAFVVRKGWLQQNKSRAQRPRRLDPPRALERPTRLYQRPIRLRAISSEQRTASPSPRHSVPAQFCFQNRWHKTQVAVGPERIESQWWEGRWVRRDYYRIQTATGHRFWIYQEMATGHWWVHGDFA